MDILRRSNWNYWHMHLFQDIRKKHTKNIEGNKDKNQN